MKVLSLINFFFYFKSLESTYTKDQYIYLVSISYDILDIVNNASWS